MQWPAMTRDASASPSPQSRLFLEGEGDRWHARNAAAANPDSLPPEIASLLLQSLDRAADEQAE